MELSLTRTSYLTKWFYRKLDIRDTKMLLM
uniref:Uncharacterized protein n=1 Tax=virus sp. ctML55 TaxID=2827627 RepID=A0A8S5RHM7_9VIRU|nr:MAG TPA: hypothetical protein [virus sp. ctML55]